MAFPFSFAMILSMSTFGLKSLLKVYSGCVTPEGQANFGVNLPHERSLWDGENSARQGAPFPEGFEKTDSRRTSPKDPATSVE